MFFISLTVLSFTGFLLVILLNFLLITVPALYYQTIELREKKMKKKHVESFVHCSCFFIIIWWSFLLPLLTGGLSTKKNCITKKCFFLLEINRFLFILRVLLAGLVVVDHSWIAYGMFSQENILKIRTWFSEISFFRVCECDFGEIRWSNDK